MNKMVILIALMVAITSVFAQEVVDENKESAELSRYQRTGGEILKKGSFLGKVVILDQQSRLAFSDIEAVAKILASATECNVIASKTDVEDAKLVIKVISDDNSPTLLIAPEDYWAQVNVAKITADLKTDRAKEKFFVSRARKEIIKGFSLLCGGGSSQFPGNIMNTTSVRALDVVPEQIPMDMVSYYQEYLKKLGVTQKEMTTYRKACREGWAPAPTNDVQKAIWDKVHEIPAGPIKIKHQKK